MNDKDKGLLEMAAKAAGFKSYGWHEATNSFWVNDGAPFVWDPLENDADAFRLATKLGLCVMFHATQVEYSKGNGQVGIIVEQTFRNIVSTRRAIVRASAEIGRMK